MKHLLIAATLVLATTAAQAQQAPTMDPAVVELQTASSDAGLIVPFLAFLVFLAAISGGKAAPVPVG